ncbi:MAG: TauD/TfdA dioxygenase family protein [Alphaproteobacteria bacterium]
MTYQSIHVRPITPAVGAEISGVDLAAPSAAQKEEIRRALIDRKVIVFRDQAISAAEYAAFMYLFGTPVREDLVTDEGRPPEVGAIHIRQSEPQRINYWHMDHSFREKPTQVLSLHAKVLPDCGGDTLFASLEAAYDGLSNEMKARIEGLETHHKVTETQNSRRRYTDEQFAAMLAAPPVRHPLVGVNPDNGRRYLFVNVPIYCRSIVGMETPEGDALLRELYLHAQRPEFQMRLVWRPNTLAIWENCHCLHYPVADYYPHERKMWRVVIEAERRPMAAAA